MAAVAALVLSASRAAATAATDADAPPTATVARRTADEHGASSTIASPENGDRIAGDTAQLEVDLEGAEIVDQTSTDLQPDQGHLHVTLDGKLVSMTSGTSQPLTDLTPGRAPACRSSSSPTTTRRSTRGCSRP